MLRRMYLKKLIICLIVIFSMFLVYLIPNKSNKINIKEELEYVDKNVKTATIFLLDSNNYLASTKVVISSEKIEEKAKELIETLIVDGNKQDNIPSGFRAVIPSNTKINNIIYDNNLIKLDFSKELMNTSAQNEEKIIEAIIYTMTSIDGIDKVIIYIDGNILSTLPKSKITLPSTLDRSFGINKEYNINKIDNINKTTVYYISEFNNTKYYVPVTKVNNDDRNKIEIIVDELSSSNIYKTNLMSYLNNNTKLLSVNENENELVMDFNSAILSDINDKEKLEEVIYTISMSINDNYNVDTVVFNVENEEIYKSTIKTLE